MLITVVSALSLAGTPSVPQTWFGATLGGDVPEGPVLTAGPEVTRLSLAGVPGMPLLEQGAGAFVEKTTSDTLTVGITDASLGSSSRTWRWNGSDEGWAEVGTSSAVFMRYSGAEGRPPGSQRAALAPGTGALTEQEGVALELAWTDLGVPAGYSVTYAECDSFDARVTAASAITAHSMRVRLRDSVDGGGITSGLNELSLPTTAGDWETSLGDGPQAVDADHQLSTTTISAHLIYEVTRPITGGSSSVYVDNLTITGFWEPQAVTPTATEAITELKPHGVGAGPIWDFSGREISTEVEVTAVDTLAVAILEEPVDEQEIGTWDSLRAALTEVQQSRLLSTVSDTLGVLFASESGQAQGSGGTPTPVDRTDTLGVRIADTARVDVSIAVTDSLSVALDDTAPPTLLQISLVEKTATDALSVTLLEQFVLAPFSGLVAHVVADELKLRLVDAAAVTNTGVVTVIEIYPYNPTISIWPANER